MADADRSEPRLSLGETWRRLNFEQRAAAVGSLLLIVSTFGPFSFVEGAIVLTAAAILLLLRRRAEGREFHVPFGDGAVIAAAGAWTAVLIVVRLFDRPPGQGMLALVCAAIVILAGVRERSKRPMDDLPGARVPDEPPPPPPASERRPEPLSDPEVDLDFHTQPTGETESLRNRSAYRDETVRLPDEPEVDPADPPEPPESLKRAKPAKVLPPRPEPGIPPPARGKPGPDEQPSLWEDPESRD